MSYALILRIMQEHFQPNISRKISRIFSLDRKKILIYKRVYCLWLIILIPACPEKRNWSLEEHQAWPKLYLTLAERDYVQKQTKRAELIRDFKQRPPKGLVRWPEVFFKFAKLINDITKLDIEHHRCRRCLYWKCFTGRCLYWKCFN